MSLSRLYDATHIEQADIVDCPSSATITARNTDSLHTNTGATGDIILTLPAAAKNLRYRFMTTVTVHQMKISAAGSDVIQWLSFGPGANLFASTDQFSCIEIVCVASGVWVVEGQPSGLWSLN